MLPTSTVNDLANEYFRKDNNVSRRSITQDRDSIFASDSLTPDPVFMALRAIVLTGPGGALIHWIDRKIEAREDRIYGSRVNVAATSTLPESTVAAIVDCEVDEQSGRKIAA